MTPRERFQTLLQGGEVDRPAWAFWRHYPHDDFTENFIAAHLRDLLHCGYDLWRISLPSAYPVIDYGIQAGFAGDLYGRPVFRNKVVFSSSNWKTLPILDAGHPVLRQMTTAVAAILQAAPPDRPVQATLFSPFTQAARLCGGVAVLLQHLRENPQAVLSGLEILAESTRCFAAALVALRIDGFFYAVQECGLGELARYRDVLLRLDLAILETGNCWLNTLHLHGEIAHMADYYDYPVNILHWDTHASGVPLTAAVGRFPGILSGGLDWPAQGWSSADACRTAVQALLQDMRGTPYMLSAGCVLPHTADPTQIAVVQHCMEAWPRLPPHARG